ncbi:recombinase family protein [Nocardiopsis sp. CT-R113]|uniref:Recombinase family protein n=1 Tax=Nocardiopsis codii TaxID=3065942 RepID=A0ABU7KHA4_9ACTN|nr:recombinase family protein [Nocardiopsis sp. CT-R113]MEE2041294.1 recombinase family protein [Nocardiopsis sp. CT-R113]
MHDPTQSPPLRLAFCGRTSTRDLQDPVKSLTRQHDRCQDVTPPDAAITAWYWDVETGMLDLDERGLGDSDDYERLGVPVPRTGGLGDLRAHAAEGRFDAVVCEEIARTARDMHTSMSLERELGGLGIPIIAADEPDMSSGLASARWLLRRQRQVLADYMRLHFLEQSWAGQATHARQGYALGAAPYGYVARPQLHRPLKRNPGWARLLDLDPDQRRPDTVATVFEMRVERRWKDHVIGSWLDSDHAAHPTVVAHGRPSTGRWTRRHARRIIAQPKYTGRQVWARAAGKDKIPRPRDQWVWSPPAHPQIVSLELWEEAQEVSRELYPPRTAPPLAQIREAAEAAGHTLDVERQSDTHTLYRVGDLLLPVPHGEMPPVTLRRILEEVEAL